MHPHHHDMNRISINVSLPPDYPSRHTPDLPCWLEAHQITG